MPDNVFVLPVKVGPPQPDLYFRIAGKVYQLEIKAQTTPVPQERKKAKVLVMPALPEYRYGSPFQSTPPGKESQEPK